MRIAPALIGGGIIAAAAVGIGALIYHDFHTGPKTTSMTNDTFSRYNRNFDNKLDIKDTSVWHGAEYLRTDTYRSGDYIYTDVHSIYNLLTAADGKGAGGVRDNQVTRDELTALFNSFDTNGDGHLKVSERAPLDRTVGEQLVDRTSYYDPQRSNSGGSGGTSPGDGPGSGGSTSPGDGPGSGGSTSPGDGPGSGSGSGSGGGTSPGDGPLIRRGN